MPSVRDRVAWDIESITFACFLRTRSTLCYCTAIEQSSKFAVIRVGFSPGDFCSLDLCFFVFQSAFTCPIRFFPRSHPFPSADLIRLNRSSVHLYKDAGESGCGSESKTGKRLGRKEIQTRARFVTHKDTKESSQCHICEYKFI